MKVEKMQTRNRLLIKTVKTGAIWNHCVTCDIAHPQSDEELHKVLDDVLDFLDVDDRDRKKREILQNLGEDIFVGWVHDGVFYASPCEDWKEIDLNRYGDPVFATDDGWEVEDELGYIETDFSKIVEPYYVCVEKT